MTDILKDSWNKFDENFAKKYLHYFPKELHRYAIADMLEKKCNPSIIDVGSGNCQIFDLIKEYNKPFLYTGIDWSKPLLDAFKNKDENIKIVQGDILEESNYDKKYDFAFVSHIIELIGSPEKLFNILSKKVDYIYVIWYEYPRFEFTNFEIKKYVNSENEKNNIITPYLRNRFSKDYFNFILEKNNLFVEQEKFMSEKDVLTIIGKKT